MRRPRLTKQVVEGTPPGLTNRFLWDGEVTGFGVRITPAGRRSYVLQYRFEGASRRITLGRHGAPWTVETARAAARDRLRALAEGEDPGGDRRPAARKTAPALTLQTLCLRYLQATGPRLAPTGARRLAGTLKAHVRPWFGERRADAIGAEDIERFLLAVARGDTNGKGGPRAAQEAVGFLSRVFVFGMRAGLCEDNPVRGTMRFRRSARERFLGPSDYARLGATLDLAEATGAFNRTALAAIRLILLTGLYPGEALGLRARDVDFGARRIAVESRARGRRLVALSAAVAEELGALPVFSEGAWLFPAPGGGPLGVHVLQALWRRLQGTAGLSGVRLTDLRYSYGAVGAGLGISLKVVGAAMGDSDPRTGDRYRAFASPEVKRACERISGEIARMIGQSPAALNSGGADPAVSGETRRLVDAVAEKTWITAREAAARAGLTSAYLSALRVRSLGPPYRKLAWRVVYDAAEIEAWITSRAVSKPRSRRRRRSER